MLRGFLRNIFRKRQAERELDDELSCWVELNAAEYVRRGMSDKEALQKARRDLGGMAQVKESVRDVRAGAWLDILIQDIRYAFRTLRKNPGFTSVAVLTLALAAGANTAIFSVVNGVLLKPLPYTDPVRLVTLWERHPAFPQFLTVAPANFYDWRAQSASFEKMAALDPYPDFILNGAGEPHRLAGAAVTADFFPLLGVKMALGRGFRATEDRAVVLSYAVWAQYFGARPGILGGQARMNDQAYTVTGVLPRDFYLAGKPSDFQARRQFDVWTNLGLASPPEAWTRSTHPLYVFGRLAPSASLPKAQAELDGIAANLRRLYPNDNKDKTIAAVPMEEHALGGVRAPLFALLAAVGMVLLIACANIANLLLTRAAARRKEIALRAALGASRNRLVRQLLTESAVLAVLGCSIGLAIAVWSVPALAAHLPADIPRASEISVDGRVLAFATLMAAFTAVVFGFVPLLQSRGVQWNARGVSLGNSRLRGAIVVSQVSLALVLLVGAGLMVKSLRALLQVSPGFRPAHLLTARLSLPPRYAGGNRFGLGLRREISAFERELAARVRAIPGVQSAAFASHLPLSGTDNDWAFWIEGRPPKPAGDFDSAHYRPVSAGYFETMGIPVTGGRGFNPRDDEDHPLVVVINQAMARRFWPGVDPVGTRLKFGNEIWRTIVGMVGDVHHSGPEIAPTPEMYVPWGQVPNVEIRPTIVVRASVEPASLAGALRKAVAEVDPEVPMDQVASMDQLVSGSVSESRFRAIALSVFALLALFVASVGLYGVMSCLAGQRTREFGIRMAVGARRGDVLALVLRQAVKLAALGVAIGLLGAALLSRMIATLLYGVKPLDPTTLAGVSVLLAAVTLLASYIPARRAALADPVESLREE